MKQNIARLGLFVFYDGQGIVDDYVIRLLEAFRPNFKRLIVICNGKIGHDGREALQEHCDDIFVRPNQGLDAAAFKEGLVSFCGWDEVQRYDEVVLINDTFFGPIHSFERMFEEMWTRDVDFWGMSAGYSSVDSWKKVKYGYTPDHIQTFFVAFRKEMVASEAFRAYWHNYNDGMNDFLSVVTQHEMVMTRHFQDLGFRWDIYADTQQYRSKYIEESFNIYHYHCHTMMRDMKFPIIKKKTMNVSIPDHLYMCDLEEASDALSYIRTETDYDEDLIWQNIIRLYHTTDLYQSLHLNYVLPSVRVQDAPLNEAALVYFVADPFFAQQLSRSACRMAKELDVYILPEGEQTICQVREALPDGCGVTVLEPTHQHGEMGGLLLRCKELAQRYTYLGVVHDLMNPEHFPTVIRESSVYGYLQNTANDPAYLTQVLHCLEENPRLGVLGTPFPIHHHGFGTYGNEWGGWYPAVEQLAEQLQLHCKLDMHKPPLTTTGCFWCRTDAIMPLWEKDWKAHEFYSDPVTKICGMNEALRRILPYTAQSQGYYTGIVMHTNYASMRITSQQYMLDQIVGVAREKLGCSAEFYAGFMNQLRDIRLRRGGDAVARTQAVGDGGAVQTQLGVRGALGIYLKKRLPDWLSRPLIELFRLR